MIERCAWLTAALLTLACAAPDRQPERTALPMPAGADSILLLGGTVVRRDAPNERLDLLLDRREGYLVLAAVAEDLPLEAPDTLDITGLYLHSASMFEATVDTTPSQPRRHSSAMYVIREGAGEASPARWRIDGRDVQRIEPEENRPAGPVDERVGCYALERGEWCDPSFDPARYPRLWFPDTVRLNWQYHFPVGPDPYLVATNAAGRVENPYIAAYSWSSVPPDWVQVDFWDNHHIGTRFEGRTAAAGFEGRLTVYGHGPVEAAARLTRVECPSMDPTP